MKGWIVLWAALASVPAMALDCGHFAISTFEDGDRAVSGPHRDAEAARKKGVGDRVGIEMGCLCPTPEPSAAERKACAKDAAAQAPKVFGGCSAMAEVPINRVGQAGHRLVLQRCVKTAGVRSGGASASGAAESRKAK